VIVADQPNCFPEELLVRVSSRSDGTVLDRSEGDFFTEKQLATRRSFCESNGVSYEDVVYQEIEYGDHVSFDTLAEVDDTMTTKHATSVKADALFTREVGVGLFLPVADCVATVVYDPRLQLLALLHLGRHATYTDLVGKTVRHFVAQRSNPAELIVWMSPSAQKDSYRLEWFDKESDPRWQGFYRKRDDGYYLDIPGYNRERWIDAGVWPEHISMSSVDTVNNPEYFSHSAGEKHGRIAVLAMMR
jgi:copper oxidase (laccase) domain-containing protein